MLNYKNQYDRVSTELKASEAKVANMMRYFSDCIDEEGWDETQTSRHKILLGFLSESIVPYQQDLSSILGVDQFGNSRLNEETNSRGDTSMQLPQIPSISLAAQDPPPIDFGAGLNILGGVPTSRLDNSRIGSVNDLNDFEEKKVDLEQSMQTPRSSKTMQTDTANGEKLTHLAKQRKDKLLKMTAYIKERCDTYLRKFDDIEQEERLQRIKDIEQTRKGGQPQGGLSSVAQKNNLLVEPKGRNKGGFSYPAQIATSEMYDHKQRGLEAEETLTARGEGHNSGDLTQPGLKSSGNLEAPNSSRRGAGLSSSNKSDNSDGTTKRSSIFKQCSHRSYGLAWMMKNAENSKKPT